MAGQLQLLMEIKLDISGTPCSNWSSDYASIIHPQMCGRYTSLIAFGNFLVAATCIAHVLIAHVMYILPILF
ncbi:Kelch-like ECH-associated protein 1B [Trichinella spiralis]